MTQITAARRLIYFRYKRSSCNAMRSVTLQSYAQPLRSMADVFPHYKHILYQKKGKALGTLFHQEEYYCMELT